MCTKMNTGDFIFVAHVFGTSTRSPGRCRLSVNKLTDLSAWYTESNLHKSLEKVGQMIRKIHENPASHGRALSGIWKALKVSSVRFIYCLHVMCMHPPPVAPASAAGCQYGRDIHNRLSQLTNLSKIGGYFLCIRSARSPLKCSRWFKRLFSKEKSIVDYGLLTKHI